MPISKSLFILTSAFRWSIASLSPCCAFQSSTSSALVGAAGSAVGAASSSPFYFSYKRSSKRRMVMLHGRRIPEDEQQQQQTMDVQLYNDDGTEMDGVQIHLENIEDGVNEYYSSGNGIVDNGNAIGNDGNGDGGGGGDKEDKNKSKKLIECTASILLPFAEDVAFDAFSDLTRQPSWCKYLHSVEYIGITNDDSDMEDTTTNNIPLRQSKWTVGVKGLRFSWTATDTNIVRPKRIEWESTSGLKNMGIVEFVPQTSPSTATAAAATTTTTTTTTSTKTTLMKLDFRFVTPRVVSSLFRRSGKIRKYTEDVLLTNMLTDFRDVVLEEDLRT
mmetsp:Transcript_34014/g.62555  ORF Transcript_34014/g.62555 Transcript_34014/m.62555 type:complete len:331 (-) Transcript_34014:60-1052(-)